MPIENFKYEPTVYDTASAKKLVPLLIEIFHPGSVLDLGCGNGAWLSVFLESGLTDVLGVDGPWVKEEELMIPLGNFEEANLELPLKLSRKFDLAISLETAEHLEEMYAEILVRSLVEHSDNIVFSAAVPGQPGDGHLNLQPPEYWAQKFRNLGYRCYDCIRPFIWNDPDVHWWYRQNIFIATKHDLHGYEPGPIKHMEHPEMKALIKQFSNPQNPSLLNRFIHKMRSILKN